MSDIQARLKAINAKQTAEYARLYDASGKAIVLIGVLALFGISLVVADQKFADDDRTNQEVNAYVYRR